AVAPERRLDRVLAKAAGCVGGSVAGAVRWPGSGDLDSARSSGPLERLEDRALGDPVTTLEIGSFRVERGDRAQGVGQMVEDEDEIGLDERRRRGADRIPIGQRYGRLERADRVIGDGADRATR